VRNEEVPFVGECWEGALLWPRTSMLTDARCSGAIPPSSAIV
jgi:hypothetical protein